MKNLLLFSTEMCDISNVLSRTQPLKTEKTTRPQAVSWLQYDKNSALCRLKMISDIVEILFILPHINHALATHHRCGELLMGFLHSA